MPRFFAAALVATALVAASCGGAAKKSDTPSPEPTPTAPSRVFTQSDATALLERALLKLADLPPDFANASDTLTDNAAATQARPADADLNQRCGRLLGRTIVNNASDTVSTYLAGQTVSFFSTGTVYATSQGASECAAANAARLAAPGALAREFGPLYVNPDAVNITPVEFPQVADGSFAATLDGDINAMGLTVNLTILVVGFRNGNVTGAVGSARGATIPPTDELKPLVDLVVSRITESQ